MATTLRIKIDGDPSGFQRAVKDTEKSADGLGKSFGGLATKMAAAFAAVGAAGFAKDAIGAAADVGEQFSKLKVLVGNSADALGDWAKTTAGSIGVSRREALTGLGTFANLFQVMGKGQVETAAMSKKFVELATDMASFNNANPAEVIEALGAALRGESEPIRRFGVMLDDATLKERALRMGLIETTTGTLPPAIKMQAAYAEVLAQTGKQQGDVRRTAESLSNQTRFLSAEWEDAKVKLGEGLLPIAAQLVGVFREKLLPAFEAAIPVISEMVRMVGGATSQMLGLIEPLAGAAGSLTVFAAGAAGTAIGLQKLGEGVAFVKAQFAAAQLSMGTFAGTVGILAAAVGGLATLGFVIAARHAAETKQTTEELTEALRSAGDPTQQLADWLGQLSEKLKEVKTDEQGAKKSVEDFNAAWAASKQDRDGTIESFNELGISAAKAAELAKGGGRAFADAFSEATSTSNDLSVQIENLDQVLRDADSAQAEFIRGLFDQAAQGKISVEQLQDVLGTLSELTGAYNKNRQAAADAAKEAANLAVSKGEVEKAWLDEQLAVNASKDEVQRWIAVGDALQKKLADLVPVTDKASGATDGLTESNKKATKSAEELRKAEEETKEAIEDRLEAVLESIDANLAYENRTIALAESHQTLFQKSHDAAEATRVYGAESKAAAEAQYEYEQQLQDTKGAVLGQAAASVAAAEKTAEMAGKTLDATQKNDVYRESLVRVRDATGDPNLAGYLDMLIGQIDAQRFAAQQAEIATRNWGRAIADVANGAELNFTGRDSSGGAVVRRATGGPVWPGRTYLVGEHGPEMLRFDGTGPGEVLSAPESAAAGWPSQWGPTVIQDGVAHFPGGGTTPVAGLAGGGGGSSLIGPRGLGDAADAGLSLRSVSPLGGGGTLTINISGVVGERDAVLRWIVEGLRRYGMAVG